MAHGIGHNSPDGKRTHAITFEMDADLMERLHPGPSWKSGHDEILEILENHGFDRKQGDLYVGGDGTNAVTCVLAIQDVAAKLDWFGSAVRDVRMLRIEENNDLRPAIGGGS